jgi:nitrate/TMAO reductase-like tetraheme cytochrome c subunit
MKSCSNCKKPINEREATSHHKKKGGTQVLCISCHQKTKVHQKFTRKGKIKKIKNRDL